MVAVTSACTTVARQYRYANSYSTIQHDWFFMGFMSPYERSRVLLLTRLDDRWSKESEVTKTLAHLAEAVTAA